MNVEIIENIQASVVKILCKNTAGTVFVGTGIRTSPSSFVTCAHLTLGVNRLRTIIEGVSTKQNILENENPWEAAKSSIQSLVIRDANGTDHPASITAFDPANDIATLKADVPGLIANIDTSAVILPGQELLLFGFPYTIDTREEDWPFAVYSGMASRSIEAFVGGVQRRKYTEIVGVSFGGSAALKGVAI